MSNKRGDLEVFQNLFVSIAEERGAVLRRTAFSTNIKERHEYSWADFRIGADNKSYTFVTGSREVPNCGTPPPRYPMPNSMSNKRGDLEVFRNLFVSIAAEMGAVLRRAPFSTNIKERRDYSCADFRIGADNKSYTFVTGSRDVPNCGTPPPPVPDAQ